MSKRKRGKERKRRERALVEVKELTDEEAASMLKAWNKPGAGHMIIDSGGFIPSKEGEG